MMGKTHLAMGIAASLLVTQPHTLGECIVSVIGGSVGGVLADIDILDNDSHDSLNVQLFSMGITFILLILDNFLHLGICDSIFQNGILLPAAGLIAFAILWILGVFSAHRAFTHSFTAVLLYGAAVYLIHPALMLPFAIGYLSHLALDVLNKKRLPLLYPLKFGICLKLCYANKTANEIFFHIGIAITFVFALLRLLEFVLSLL